ncbi:winged helix-turn-helix domain-containing protein [Pseudoalteromonas peptidolytica]|uniref:winged helix-turn-helix domain-containing protein n=1 Tax=Pseudoalteromonas peptidolytica TaxID=61150 RepID=UPI00298E005B|nr:winged helix-turn-helix domain-containing protein [Pseudoalteromonas peptidolytica]MDW7550419.1 winged helix-turn-helix domain-containing protein [Pseudoalteromonas peptidolytica]
MRYEFAAIQFDTVNRTLTNSTSTIRLEPKPYSLLLTLIEGGGDVVSRDTLIEKVWLGRIVTESAVNKAVSTLRQHINKLDGQNEYIETIPTLGYRLVPAVTQLHKDVTPTVSSRKNIPLIAATFIFSICIALFVAYFFQAQPNASPLVPHKLTSQNGIELQLSGAPLSKSFSYLHPISPPHSELWLNRNGTNIQLLSGNLRAQTLSQDAKYIAYINDEQNCSVKQLDITAQKTQTLFPCQVIENIKLSWGRNHQELIYRKRTNIHSGYGLYRFDLNTRRHTQLTLPPATGNLKGDHLFSLSQAKDKLSVATYLGEDKHRLTIYRYPEMTIEQTIALPHHLSSITWSADGKLVYFIDANSIYSANVGNKAVTLVHKLTAPIESITLLNSNNTLLFNQYKLTSAVKLFDISENTITPVVNNQALNRLPRANHSQQVWYISDHGADSALWSVDTSTQTNVATPLPHAFNFQRFTLNHDASKVLFEYRDAIYQFDTKSQHVTEVISDELKAYVANYGKHDDEIIYSSERSGSWQLWSVNLNTDKHQQLTTKGGYSGYAHGDAIYFTKFSQPGIWQLQEGLESLIVPDVAIRNWLNWRPRGNALYYEKDNHIWQFDLNTQQEKQYLALPSSFIGQFDVLANGDIVFAQLNQPSGELWRLSLNN